jgi:hypothetical protein
VFGNAIKGKVIMQTKTPGSFETFEEMQELMHKIYAQLHNEYYSKLYEGGQGERLEKMVELASKLDMRLDYFIHPE